MMSRRAITFSILAALAGAGALGHLEMALLLASLKALILGAEFMELRLAARVHLAAYAAWTAIVGLGLLFFCA